MRQILLFTSSILLTTTFAKAQSSETFDGDYKPIRSTLEAWDPVRGAWLADAMPAVVNQEDVPVRTFPENITPMEMMALVPESTRGEIREIAQNNQNSGVDNTFWSGMNAFVRSASCSELEATSINRRPRQARSYGDPHLVTYDGERISFQAVGEFVLTRANNNRFEVQTRQKPVQDDFSLNSAVAMNVNGDRVCLYAEDFPDNFRTTPLRVNGQPVDITGGHYFLPNGGIVRKSGNNYIVDWPTGESVNARSGRTSGMNFYNVSVSIVPCGTAALSGVLGNADGNGRNDFDGDAWSTPGGIFASNNSNWERERSAFAVRNLADQHRVTQATTLFDYGMGQSTFTFTDRSYPRVIRTINDLDPVRRQRAQRACNGAGIRGADLNGCIYDNAYLSITPCPEPPIREPVVTPETVAPVREPVINSNPEPPIVPSGEVAPVRTPTPIGGAGNGGTKPKNETTSDKVNTPIVTQTRTPETNSSTTEETAPVRNTQTETSKPRRKFTWGTTTTRTPTTTSPTRTTTPTRSTPTRSTPTRSTPTRSTPTRSTPTRSTPTRSTPTRSTPTRSSPTRSTPTRSTPTRSTPTRSTPTRGGGRGGR